MSIEFSKPKFSLGLCLSADSGWSFNLFGQFIKLPFRARDVRDDDMMEKWGFSIYPFRDDDRSAHLSWGTYTKVFWLPWHWKHVDSKQLVLDCDGNWVLAAQKYYGWGFEPRSDPPDSRMSWVLPYTYGMRDGTVQHRKARIYAERREWRWRWLMALPWPRQRSQSIIVNFDQEVGERVGSWKGGCTGCGYNMLTGESPEQTLRRMEAERKFN